MKNNINNKEFENSIDNSTIENISADANNSNNNVVRDLSKNTNDKPWYKKKKTGIIAISSTLSAGILITAIAVPVALTRTSTATQNLSQMNEVKNVYSANNTSTKLVVIGTNLPNDKAMYSVSNITTVRAVGDIKPEVITLTTIVDGSEIHLDFVDSLVVANSIYQITLSEGNVIITDSTQNILQPTYTIDTHPQHHTITGSSVNKIVDLSVAISKITNPIGNEKPTYQWKSSDVDSLDEIHWKPIKNETNEIHSFDASNLADGDKKYFKCVVNYKYTAPTTSNVGSVSRVTKPTISITTQPISINVPVTLTSTTLSIAAIVINGENNPTITYQWQSSDNGAGPFANINSANSSTYNFVGLSNMNPGTKKYFKCIVSSPNLLSLESDIIYVGKNAQPVLNFTKQIGDIELSAIETSAQLSVDVLVDTLIQGQNLSYKWYEYASTSATGTLITGATHQTYSPSLTNLAVETKRYFKCEVTYNAGNKITTEFGSVIKKTPVISFTKEIGNISISTLETVNTNVVLTVQTSIAYQIAGQVPTYQWFKYTNASDLTGTVILDQTTSSYTYNTSGLQAGHTKYFKCKVSYSHAATVTSKLGTVTKKAPSIVISAHPVSQRLTLASNDTTLTVNAAIENGNATTNLSYKWQKSTVSETTGWTNIAGATSSSYVVHIGTTNAEKIAWTDKWYRCVITASGISTTSATNAARVRVELTKQQAKEELVKWLSIEANAKNILTQFFTRMDSRKRSDYYGYVHGGTFSAKPETAFHSITATKAGPVGFVFDTYNVKLRTTTATNFTVTSTGTRKLIPVGSYIEFVVMFSFTKNIELVRNVGTPNYNVPFDPEFIIGNTNKTDLVWTQDSANLPKPGNYLRDNIYPMTIYNSIDGTSIVNDSLKESVKEKISSDTYKCIPTYRIWSGK